MASAATASRPVAVTGSVPLPSFSGTEGAYMLPHHQQEIDRLTRQHRFMNSTTGGQLLITPNIKEKKELRVLDCGAADGKALKPPPFSI